MIDVISLHSNRNPYELRVLYMNRCMVLRLSQCHSLLYCPTSTGEMSNIYSSVECKCTRISPESRVPIPVALENSAIHEARSRVTSSLRLEHNICTGTWERTLRQVGRRVRNVEATFRTRIFGMSSSPRIFLTETFMAI